MSQGKVDRAITIMKKFERINNKKVDPQIYVAFKVSSIVSYFRKYYAHAIREVFFTIALIQMPHIKTCALGAAAYNGHKFNDTSISLCLYIHESRPVAHIYVAKYSALTNTTHL